jgi:hypothetical protein
MRGVVFNLPDMGLLLFINSEMVRSTFRILQLAALAVLCFSLTTSGQSRSGLTVSDHLRVQAPADRGYLARNSISEMERCWQFMNKATGGMLPRQIIVLLSMDSVENSINLKESIITIGLGNPAATYEMKSYLEHSAAREMARMGLLNLSDGTVSKNDNEFLISGMAEILVHEYTQSTRGLKSAWIIAHFLDQMKLLGLKIQSYRASYSEGESDLRAAAPGITFLEFCRDLYGRDKLKKIFEGLRKGNLSQSLFATFKSTPEALESGWLQKVREYSDISDVTVDSDEDAPQFRQAELIPDIAKAGTSLQIRLFITDAGNNLSTSAVFLKDESSGSVFQAQSPVEKKAGYMLVKLPIEASRQPGSYAYSATAVDEEGNVRNWQGTYVVQ